MNACDATPAFNRLADCSSAVWLWFLRNGLQLNTDKSEAVILGTSHQLRAAANIQTIDVAGSRLGVSDRVKSLGVTIDSHLRFDCHASNVARACSCHTLALRHVRSLLSDEVAQTVACSIVRAVSLLRDSITATLCCMAHRLRPLTSSNGHRTTSPVLSASAAAAPVPHLCCSRLHWLPVQHRITYKTAVLSHKVLTMSTVGLSTSSKTTSTAPSTTTECHYSRKFRPVSYRARELSRRRMLSTHQT